jgi:hypothetical protein
VSFKIIPFGSSGGASNQGANVALDRSHARTATPPLPSQPGKSEHRTTSTVYLDDRLIRLANDQAQARGLSVVEEIEAQLWKCYNSVRSGKSKRRVGRGKPKTRFYALLRQHIGILLGDSGDSIDASMRQMATGLGISANIFGRLHRYSLAHRDALLAARRSGDWREIERDLFGAFGQYWHLPFYKRAVADTESGHRCNDGSKADRP